MTDAAVLAPDDAVRPPPVPRDEGVRLAAWVFGVAAVGAFVTYLVIGRDVWFFYDEWNFLAVRSLTVHGVFAPHEGHFVALPVVVYRTLFALFGLRTYLPYQVLSVGVHVVAAVLLRVVMRRAGVGPWIATAAAGLLLFFGAGGQDIIWGFQITFGGALVFGLAQLLLADHDGPVDRRDGLALASGLAALACSGVAVTMVIVVGLAMLGRRGWRVAALQTAPLAAVFGVWFLAIGHREAPSLTRIGVLRWGGRGFSATFDALGQASVVGWILAAVLVVGLVLAWIQRGEFQMLRTRAVLPLALLAGAFIFVLLTGSARVLSGNGIGDESRYLHILAALVLPALALAADAVVRAFHGSRALTVAFVLLFLVGIPGNMRVARDTMPNASYFRTQKQLMRSLPRLDLATRVSAGSHPDPNEAPPVSVGWLLDTLRSGRLPGPIPLTQEQQATYDLVLSLDETVTSNVPTCAPLVAPTEFVLQKGETLGVRGWIVVRIQHGRVRSDPVAYGNSYIAGYQPKQLTAQTGPLALQIEARPGAPPRSAFVCASAR